MLLTLYNPIWQTGNPQTIIGIQPGGAGTTQTASTIPNEYNPYIGVATEEGIYREAQDSPVQGIYNVTTATPQGTLVAVIPQALNTGGGAWSIPQQYGAQLAKLQYGCVNRRSDVTSDPGGFMQVCSEGPFIANCNSSNGNAITYGTLLTTDGNGNLTAFNSPAAPTAPTFAAIGTSGVIGYTYGLIAVSPNGTYSAMVTAQATSGNATLTNANAVQIIATAQPDVVGWLVVRTAVSAGGSPTTLGTIGYIPYPSTTFNDTGLAPAPGTSATQFFQRYTGLSAPTVTTAGTAGSTTWNYQISAISPNGVWSVQSASAGTTAGNATLSATNYNTITGTAVSGAVLYAINRSTAGGTPSSTGIIGYVTSITVGLRDIGLPSLGTLASQNQLTPNVTPAPGTCLATSMGVLAASVTGSTLVPVLLGGF